MSGEPKTRKLTLLLLRESVKTPEDAIRDDVLKDGRRYKWYDLKDNLGFNGAFFLRRKPAKEPKWVEFINEGLDKPLEKITTKSAAGILFVEISYKKKRRILAFTFGFARTLLKSESYEYDFGLKTVLSAVSPEGMHAIEYKTVAEIIRNTLQQTSRHAPLANFDLDFTRDLLRAVSGKPKEDRLGNRVDGGDSLALTTKIDFRDFAKLSGSILDIYYSDLCEENFPGYDSFRNIKEKEVVDRLDRLLIDSIKKNDLSKIHLAPPEIVPLEIIQGYKYSYEEENIRPELDIGEFASTLELSELTVDELKKRRKIWQFGLAVDEPLAYWPAYKCLVFEVSEEGLVYVLSDGKWYKVTQDLVDTIDDYIKALDPASLTLPEARLGETEPAYNARVAKSMPEAVLLDRKVIKTKRWNSPVEPCDLFTLNNKFVHVKKGTFSSKLSHLFAQGSVSAMLFIEDREFRQKIRERIGEDNLEHFRLIPEDKPVPSIYEVVFAIMCKPRPGGPLSLPFFSRLNFRFHGQIIERFGYKVSLTLIDQS